MESIYINGIGVDSGAYHSLSELRALLNTPSLTQSQFNDVSLINKAIVQRGDRAVLNQVTLMAVNALNDLLSQTHYEDKSDWNIFTACDYSSDDNLLSDGISYILEQNKERFWHALSMFSDIVNPLELLRGLSTNTLYHISKILNNTGKGVPVDSGNLSGVASLSFIVDNKQTLIISAGGLTGTKEKATRIKNNPEVPLPENLTWGSCALLAGRLTPHSLGRIIDIALISTPDVNLPGHFEKIFNALDKETLYAIPFGDREWNGININCALKQIDYDVLGHTGRPDMLLKMAAFLIDDTIPDNSVACLSGFDAQYGYGHVIIQKGV